MSLKRLFAKFQKTAKNSVFGPIWPKMSDIWPILDLFYSIWTLFDPLLMYFWRLCKGIYPWFEGPKWVKVNPLNRILDQNVVNNPDILVDNPDLSVMFLEIGINTPNILLNNPICTTWLAHAYWLIESRLDGVGSSFRVLMCWWWGQEVCDGVGGWYHSLEWWEGIYTWFHIWGDVVLIQVSGYPFNMSIILQ